MQGVVRLMFYAHISFIYLDIILAAIVLKFIFNNSLKSLHTVPSFVLSKEFYSPFYLRTLFGTFKPQFK